MPANTMGEPTVTVIELVTNQRDGSIETIVQTDEVSEFLRSFHHNKVHPAIRIANDPRIIATMDILGEGVQNSEFMLYIMRYSNNEYRFFVVRRPELGPDVPLLCRALSQILDVCQPFFKRYCGVSTTAAAAPDRPVYIVQDNEACFGWMLNDTVVNSTMHQQFKLSSSTWDFFVRTVKNIDDAFARNNRPTGSAELLRKPIESDNGEAVVVMWRSSDKIKRPRDIWSLKLSSGSDERDDAFLIALAAVRRPNRNFGVFVFAWFPVTASTDFSKRIAYYAGSDTFRSLAGEILSQTSLGPDWDGSYWYDAQKIAIRDGRERL